MKRRKYKIVTTIWNWLWRREDSELWRKSKLFYYRSCGSWAEGKAATWQFSNVIMAVVRREE